MVLSLWLNLGTGLAAPLTVASPSPSASSVVEHFYGKLLATMKQGETLGFEGRVHALTPVVTRAFDMPLMARLSAGPAWATKSDGERTELIKVFTTWTVATYADRFPRFTGEAFEVLTEKPLPSGGVMVETRLHPAGAPSVALNYLVRVGPDGTPRIADVFLENTVSELATRRAEFTAVIAQNGWDSLVALLDEKTRKMKGA